jgi:hypothetical protein
MGDIPVEVALHIRAQHAEGPLWDAETARLWWVDITGERVHCFDPRSGSDISWSTSGQPGGVILTTAGEPVVASPDGLALLDRATGRMDLGVPVEQDRRENAYYRGAALPMAADLATTPASGLRVQLCGDAHLSNFGAFASPERTLVFDVNDFDETLPGPFEWDVKRLTASLAVAGRDNGFSAKVRRKIALAAASGYRTAMRQFADQPLLAVWYAHLLIEQAFGQFRAQVKKSRFKAATGLLAKAHTADNTKAPGKLTTGVDGQAQEQASRVAGT